MATPPCELDFNPAQPGFWMQPEPDRLAAFARARQQGRPLWSPLPPTPLVKSKPGFYSLFGHADVKEASRRADLFSSEPTANTLYELPSWAAYFYGSMINMDNPRHARIRRVVGQAFTPRVLKKLDADLQSRSVRIVDDLIRQGPREFVEQVAAKLPIQVISDLMGIPERHHQRIFDRTNTILGHLDTEFNGMKLSDHYRTGEMRFLDVLATSSRVLHAGMDLFWMVQRLGAARKRAPADDLISRLVTPDENGETLTPQEVGSFFILLVAAGNETTRNSIAHALHLLTRFPDQRDLLLSDFDGHIGGAVDEVVRFATPVRQFRRNLTQDHELGGTLLRKGDMVVLWYTSANRDESVFTEPDQFDITRTPNPHVAFGGPGPHFCMGSHLARREITVILRELLTRLPDIRTTGEPDFLVSSFLNGIKRMPFTFTAPRSAARGI
ncbi:cytochrome P450 [Nocardia cyriacigeorgica]|uniref:cytochrome P450 n=1 Tax=Nocardia cyriacigeorgica TaxID=135487 RepID=UPI0024585050|nr:cytochrome P450 [Nocardia cyriacigeorgica]